jgi:hypothetical protein
MPTPGLHGIAAGRFAAKVNLNTIREVKQPRSAGDDLRSLRWPALQGVSRQLSWWLSPADHDGKRDFAGAALVIFVYALWLIAFWQFQTRFGRPY